MTEKTGGYPTLQSIYLDYLKTSCGENNKYTYEKMLGYSQALGDYWIKIIEQMVPSTTLWTSGVKVENSVFNRDKFVYKCYSMTEVTMPIIPSVVISAATTGYTSFSAPQYQARMGSMPPPANPVPNTRYYNNIASGNTSNPMST